MYALAGIKFQMMFLLCMMNPTVLLTWTSRGSNESGHILKSRYASIFTKFSDQVADQIIYVLLHVD